MFSVFASRPLEVSVVADDKDDGIAEAALDVCTLGLPTNLGFGYEPRALVKSARERDNILKEHRRAEARNREVRAGGNKGLARLELGPSRGKRETACGQVRVPDILYNVHNGV